MSNIDRPFRNRVHVRDCGDCGILQYSERTRNMLKVASEMVNLRAEGERLAQNQMAQGIVLVSERRHASAASYKAQADMLQAQLVHLLARAELEQTSGRTPGR